MKKKQKSGNENTTKKLSAFNPRYLVWVLGFGVALWGNIYLFVDKMNFPGFYY